MGRAHLEGVHQNIQAFLTVVKYGAVNKCRWVSVVAESTVSEFGTWYDNLSIQGGLYCYTGQTT